MRTRYQKMSRDIYALEDNWDGEGAKRYLKSTIKMALSFVEDIEKRIGPRDFCILTGPNGSIDILLKKKEINFALLINIPENLDVYPDLYGWCDDSSIKMTVYDDGNNMSVLSDWIAKYDKSIS